MPADRLPPLPVSLLPKGTSFTRCAIALAGGRGKLVDSLEIARERWPHQQEVADFLKTAITAGGTSSGSWAEQLVVTPMVAEFVEVLRAQSIVGRMQGLRMAPFNCVMARTTGGASAAWVGQTDPTPVSKLTLDTISLSYSKIVSIVALTDELIRLSTPAAESVVRRDLINALASYMDQQFIDPTVSAVVDVSPASISYGAPSVASTGSSVAQIVTDTKAMFALGIAANISYSTGVWVMHPRTALHLGSVLTAGNSPMWPTINIKGGSWQGLPVITSSAVPIDTGDDTRIFLMDAQEILLAQGPVQLDASNQAALQMSGAPSDAAAQMVSLWQMNYTGIKATQWLRWARAHDAACITLEDVSY